MAPDRASREEKIHVRTAIGRVAASANAGGRQRNIGRARVSDVASRRVGQDDATAAQHQDTPSGIYSCGLCTLFERPNACKVVEGEVSKDGWCKAFAMAD
jgi:hypothetical protein